MTFLPKWTAPGQRASAVPLACFRILFGLCLFLDVLGLLEYAPLWFDPVPLYEQGSEWAKPLLGIWLLAALGLTLGAYTRASAVMNYISCVVFMGFYAMPASCEFHLDPLYLLTSSALPFLPIGKVLSVDALRNPPETRSIGPAAEIFFALVISSIYLDSALWKLSSSMWISGLGYWTPAVQPWPGQPSFAWTLDNQWIARGAGYMTLIFELCFLVLVWFRPLRLPLLSIGFALHIGIGTVLPLPLFGLIMCAFLVALLPMHAPEDEQGLAGERAKERRHPLLRIYYSFWALMFAIGLIDPMLAIAREGIGGSATTQHRTWYAESNTTLERAFSRGMFWAYRLFGFRSHPIFIDDQFSLNTTQTRLRFHPSSKAQTAQEAFLIPEEGAAFRPPAYNRRFLAWNYRTVYPPIPLSRVEQRLSRFLAYHVGRGDIDLERGWVAIEQRPIEMPVDRWRAGQRERNMSGSWQRVGVVRGSPGQLQYSWRNPCWPASDETEN